MTVADYFATSVSVDNSKSTTEVVPLRTPEEVMEKRLNDTYKKSVIELLKEIRNISLGKKPTAIEENRDKAILEELVKNNILTRTLLDTAARRNYVNSMNVVYRLPTWVATATPGTCVKHIIYTHEGEVKKIYYTDHQGTKLDGVIELLPYNPSNLQPAVNLTDVNGNSLATAGPAQPTSTN